MHHFIARASALAVAVAGLSNSAEAAEIKVLTAGAFKTVLLALTPGFEQRSGHKLVIDNDTAGALQKRIAGGEAFDLVVLTPGALEQLGKSGQIAAGSSRKLARVAIGVAVKAGAPLPDISSVAAFQKTLTSARAVATIDPASGGSSGIYLWQWFEKVGIAAQLKPKAVLVNGGLVAPRLLNGEADIAIHQISEILPVAGVTLVGPIPAEIQNYTVYAAGISAAARDAAAAQALVDWLSSPAAAAVFKEKGMEMP